MFYIKLGHSFIRQDPLNFYLNMKRNVCHTTFYKTVTPRERGKKQTRRCGNFFPNNKLIVKRQIAEMTEISFRKWISTKKL